MKALIVDDSHFIREYVRQNMERFGWECTEAENGCEAVAVAQEAGREGRGFDVLLLDVNMPVLDVLQCVKQLRDEGLASGTKVMMVTTEADSSYIRKALEYGADEFLMKPFSPQSLREKLVLMGFDMAA